MHKHNIKRRFSTGRLWKTTTAFVLLFVTLSITAGAQVSCTGDVPTYTIDFTGNPGGVYTTPSIIRQGNCCGTSSPDRCIHFVITLDTDAVALNFEIASGAIPPGALYYQINCGPQIVAGQYICISGVGPHHLTFCKPGNNDNVYRITSIPAPLFPYDDSVRVGCSKVFSVLGLTAASTTWNSIYPGTSGQYNNLLSCTSGCTNPTFTPVDGLPPYIDYVICGAPIASNCLSITQFCDTVRIFIYPELEATITPNPATYCPSAAGALLTASSTGGLPPYSYVWKNGGGTVVSTTATYFATTAGTYTVEITDGLYPDCPKITGTVPVSVSNVVLTMSSTDVSCKGGSDGSAQVSISGGTSPYTIAWSNGATQQSNTGLTAGTYTVTVTDAGGCVKNATVTVNEPAATLNQVISGSNVICFGTATGLASTVASGGTAPYTYIWSNGNISPSITNINAGTYSVTVTDAKGCTQASSVTITQPTALSVSTSASTNASCFGFSDGTATAVAAGGTPSYSYVWSNGTSAAITTGLSAGTYTVTATDGNGCTATTTVTISQPAAPLSSSITGTTDASCYGFANGSANVSASGGTTPYTYQWNTGATTPVLNNIPAGNYIVTVTDAKGCTSQQSTTVSQPAAPLSAGTTKSNVLCFGNATGQAVVNASGGTAPYNYLWSNGAVTQTNSNLSAGTYTVTVTDANGCVATSSATISQPAAALSASGTTTAVKCFGDATGAITQNVSGGTAPYAYQWSNGATGMSLSSITAGTYSVTITDANGCTLVKSYSVTQPAAALSAALTATTDVSCFGLSNGAINITASGGTLPYTYQWSNGASTADLSGITSGSYTVTVTDKNNCTTGINAIIINQPAAPLTSSLSSTNVSCRNGNDGALSATVNGGTTPYSYQWNTGASGSAVNTLTAGSYTVTVTDAQGCTSTSTATITQPAAVLNASATVTDINCIGNVSGGVDVSVTGGTSPYSYSWSNGSTQQDITNIVAATYTITVTDANGCTTSLSATVSQPPGALNAAPVVTNVNCFSDATGAIILNTTAGTPPYSFNWSTGSSSENISNLIAGTYTVTITDANGCELTNTLFVTEPSQPLSATSAVQNVDCFGNLTGAADLSPAGGTAPYAYQWNNGWTSEDLSGVSQGNYTVTITDANNCTVQHTLSIQQPAASLSTVAAITNLNCYDIDNGVIDITTTGGTAPYTFNWSNGSSNEDLTGLSAGSYAVTVTDANGCTNGLQYEIIYNTSPIAASSVPTDILCHGNLTGAVDLTVNGGTPPFTFVWNNGDTEEDLDNIAAGTYSVTITDANGCTAGYNTSLSEPAASLQATNIISDELCFQNYTGSIDITPSGGTAPYIYSWNDGTTGEDLGGITSGSYTVTITDNNGCTWSDNFMVNGPQALLTAGITSTDVACFGDNSGSVAAVLAGGTVPYSVSWNTGDTTSSLSNISAGIYTITVTDANACQSVQSVIINQPAQALSATAQATDIDCFSNASGTITLNPTGGTAPYQVVWSNGATGTTISGLTAATYNYTVTDANNCEFNGSATVNQPVGSLQVSATTNPVLCFGDASGSITLTASGGTPSYQYQWNNGMQSAVLNNLPAGTYTATVTDANNCIYTQSYTIAQPAATLQVTSSVANLICYNDNTGSISLNVTGGTGPYSYQWNNGSTIQNISGAASGTYTVTVTDANGCSLNNTSVITQPAASINVNSTATNVTCKGLNNGSISMTITGGVPAYQILWNTGSTDEFITALAPGNYSALITDANGCSYTFNTAITEPANGLTVAASATTANCLMSQPATVSANVAGGTAPYQYSWSNGSTASSVTNIYNGNFIVTVTDANGCTAIHSASVSDNSVLNISADGPTEVCVGTAVTLTASSYPGVQYQWLYNNSPLNGATSNAFSTVAPGTYTLTATTACGTYNSNPVVVVTRSLDNVSISNSFIICPGGQAQLVAGGGTTYEWEPQQGLSDYTSSNPVASPSQTTQYTVTVTDDFGCKATASVTVTILCDTLDIPNGYSPNSDGTNDNFVIDGLSLYPENTLFIYNRWGNLVFKERNYSNKWNGVSNVDGIFFGRILPDGTYYYILDLHNDQKPLNGFVVIKR